MSGHAGHIDPANKKVTVLRLASAQIITGGVALLWIAHALGGTGVASSLIELFWPAAGHPFQ